MNAGFAPYRDFWVRFITSIVLAFFFVFIGSDSISDIINGRYFIQDTLSGFVLTFIVTSYINIITAYLDIHYSWNKFLATRLIYQLIAGVIIVAVFVLAYMYTYLIVLLGFSKTEVTFFTTEFPISILFIVFWNLLYVGYYFYRENKTQKKELENLQEQLFTFQNVITGDESIHASSTTINTEEPADENDFSANATTTKLKILIAVAGNKNIPIPVETIAFFYKSGNYTTLKTFQADTYLLNHSLDELVSILEESLFFRANRQFIINLNACRFFTNEENGKLALHLFPENEEDVIISQKRAPVFKEWLNK